LNRGSKRVDAFRFRRPIRRAHEKSGALLDVERVQRPPAAPLLARDRFGDERGIAGAHRDHRARRIERRERFGLREAQHLELLLLLELLFRLGDAIRRAFGDEAELIEPVGEPLAARAERHHQAEDDEQRAEDRRGDLDVQVGAPGDDDHRRREKSEPELPSALARTPAQHVKSGRAEHETAEQSERVEAAERLEISARERDDEHRHDRRDEDRDLRRLEVAIAPREDRRHVTALGEREEHVVAADDRRVRRKKEQRRRGDDDGGFDPLAAEHETELGDETLVVGVLDRRLEQRDREQREHGRRRDHGPHDVAHAAFRGGLDREAHRRAELADALEPGESEPRAGEADQERFGRHASSEVEVRFHRGPLLGPEVEQRRADDDQVDDERAARHRERQDRALADADRVHDREQQQRRDRQRHDVLVEEREHAPEVVDAGDRRDRGRQEVIDRDQETADAAHDRRERLRRDADHASAVRIPPADLDVLRGQEEKTDHRSQHEKRRGVADFRIRVEDSRHVVHRRADVAEHDGPYEQRRELTQARLRRRTQLLLRARGRGCESGPTRAGRIGRHGSKPPR
jgi:hypothetical protein